MGWRRGSLLLLALAWAFPAFAIEPGKCTRITTVTTSSIVSTTPVRVCSVEFFATADNAWAQVYDARALTASRANVAEPGGGTARHAFVDFGEEGIVTDQGLGVDVSSGTSGVQVLIRWGE